MTIESQNKSGTSTVDDLFKAVAACMLEASGWHLQANPRGWLLVECGANRVNQSFEIKRRLHELELWRTECTGRGPQRLGIVAIDSMGTITDVWAFLEMADPMICAAKPDA